MKTLRALLIASLLALAAGCGDDEEPASKAKKTPAATQSAADAEADVRETFTGYNAALAERDYDDACEALAPETTAKLRENVKQLGIADPPEKCADVLKLVYDTADKDPQQKKLLEEIVSSAKIESVKVTGEKAIVNWSATVQGTKTPVSQSARRIDGEWKLVDVTN